MNRLQFLKRLLTTTAAAVVAPKLLASSTNKVERKKFVMPTEKRPMCFIQIANLSNKIVENVTVGLGAENLNGINNDERIQLYASVGNFDRYKPYDDYLKHAVKNPFLVHIMHVQEGRSYGPAKYLQAKQAYRIESIDENCNKIDKIITPYFDEHVGLKDLSCDITPFVIDGHEKITISRMFPLTEVWLTIHPVNPNTPKFSPEPLSPFPY